MELTYNWRWVDVETTIMQHDITTGESRTRVERNPGMVRRATGMRPDGTPVDGHVDEPFIPLHVCAACEHTKKHPS